MLDSKELLFWIPTHNDAHRLTNAIASIRTIYRNAMVVVYCDRDPQATWSTRVAAHFGAEVVRYDGASHYASWPRIRTLHRGWFEWFRDRRFPWFLKFDTDALLLHPFHSLPERCAFGRVVRAPWGSFLQGGCYGLDRQAVQRILASEVPSTAEVQAQRGLLKRQQPQDEDGTPLTNEDQFLGWCLQRAGVAQRDFAQIASYGPRRKIPVDRRRTAAVIHPVRDFANGSRILSSLTGNT